MAAADKTILCDFMGGTICYYNGGGACFEHGYF